MNKNKHALWVIAYAAVLTVFTVYLLMDTFLLRKAYISDATEINSDMFSETTEESGIEADLPYAIATEETDDDSVKYQDDHISITVTEYRQYNTAVYVADVVLSSAQYLKTAFARDTYGRNITEKTSVTASNHNAVLAINGDYYGAQERGIVIRNGIVYRSTPAGKDLLCILSDGSMQIIADRTYPADELIEKGVWQAFCFGPALIRDGQIAVDAHDEVGKAMVSNPRTAIGLIDSNHFVFVVSDGRTRQSEGLSLLELARFMQDLGVRTAYNLDGGGSSTMYFNGQVINNPTSTGRISERSVSDIVYIQ